MHFLITLLALTSSALGLTVHTRPGQGITPANGADIPGGILSNLTVRAATFTNPVKQTDGSDPYMIYSNGYYYLTTTTWTNIQITRATTINGLKSATPKIVWTDSTASRCCNIWAPEIHWSFDKWHIYYTAGTSDTFDNQRIHVLEGSSTDIWGSTWSYKSRITIPDRDVWAIDATLMFLGSSTYLLYSSFDGSDQCLWISQMSDAVTVGATTKISTPTYDWEMVGANVNEGPAMLYYGGRTFLIYSASDCAGTGYTLGQIELTGSDPLSASSWTKYSKPVLSSANGNYEPGHNGFFTDPAGDIYIVFHASSTSPGTCDGNRYTMVQPVYWHTDNSPNFGSPRPLTDAIPEPS